MSTLLSSYTYFFHKFSEIPGYSKQVVKKKNSTNKEHFLFLFYTYTHLVFNNYLVKNASIPFYFLFKLTIDIPREISTRVVFYFYIK